ARGEAVQHDGVLTHGRVHVQEHRRTELTDDAERPRGNEDAVADPTHLDQQLAPREAIQQDAAQGPDHRPPSAAAMRASLGAKARWHRARARASATSGGRGAWASPSMRCTMRWTWSLVAAP